jgi:hypothetical protein
MIGMDDAVWFCSQCIVNTDIFNITSTVRLKT